jgi:hypothetical protein
MDVQVGGTNLAELAETIISGVSSQFLPQFGYSTHAVKEGSS